MKTSTFFKIFTLMGLMIVLFLVPPQIQAATNVTVSTGATSGITYSAGTYTPNTGVASAVINVTELQTYLASANVTILTASTGASAGSITISNAINWNSSYSLTMNAVASLTTNASITNNGTGALTLLAAQGADGILTLNSGFSLTTTGGNISITSGTTTWKGSLTIQASIFSNNGNITIANTTAGASTNDRNFINTGTISSGAGSIFINNYAKVSGGAICNGAEFSNGTIQSTTGSIIINGFGGAGSNRGEGIIFVGGYTISSTTGPITITGQGAGTNRGDGIHFWGDGATTKIYSISGNINLTAKAASGEAFLTDHYISGVAACTVYIGYDGTSAGTSGNVTLEADAPGNVLWRSGGTFKIKGQGNLAIQSHSSVGTPTYGFTCSGIIQGSAWKKITIGDPYMGPIVLSDNLTNDFTDGDSIQVVSKKDITLNNPITNNGSNTPILLLAAQGSAGTGTLTTVTAATLTTNNGEIKLCSGVSADGSVISTAAGHIVANGTINMGTSGSQPVDWRASGNLTLSTNINTSASSNIPVSLMAAQGVGGTLTVNNPITTASGTIDILAGTSTIKGYIDLVETSTLTSNGGKVTIQNGTAGSYGDHGIRSRGNISAGAGDIVMTGYESAGKWDGMWIGKGMIQTTTGKITISGYGANGGSNRSDGMFLGHEGLLDIHTTSGDIAITGTGSATGGTRNDGIIFSGANSTKIYSTTGKIDITATAYSDQGIYSGAWGSSPIYIGSSDGAKNGTTGDITILAGIKTGSSGGNMIWNGNNYTFKIGGTGNLTIKTSETGTNTGFTSNGFLATGSIWKSITIGDVYAGNITLNDNLTTSATATDGITVISKSNITLNKPLNTSAKAAIPITLLAAQGAAGTLTTATAATLTTDGGLINLRSGVNADASTLWNVAGHMSVSGLVSYTSTPLAIDWRTSGDLVINTPLNTSAIADKTITLLAGQKYATGGRLVVNGNLTTQNADIKLYGGLDADGTETGVKGSVGIVTGVTVNAGIGNVLLKNTSLGSIGTIAYADKAGIQLNLINTTGFTMATSGLSTIIGKDITLTGYGVSTSDESRGIDDAGSLIDASGNIYLTGISGTLANTSSDGIRFLSEGSANTITHTIRTSGITSTITLDANGKYNSYGGITLWSNTTNRVAIYNTGGTGNILIKAVCANTSNGRPFHDERLTTGATQVYIGWDGTSDDNNLTKGDIIMRLTGGVDQYFSATPRTFLKTNGGNVSIVDDGTNNLGAITIPNNMIVSSGSYKNFTIGGLKTSGITINSTLTTNGESTTGILVTSKSNITIGDGTNGGLNTFAKANIPITLLAAQGATGDLKISNNLTTNSGLITVYAGLDVNAGTTFQKGTIKFEGTATTSSNGGNIVIKNTAQGGTNVMNSQGVLTYGIINAEGISTGGNITINGYGQVSGAYVDGVYLNGTVKTNNDGYINIIGTGGAGSQRSMGIFIGENNNTTIHTEGGNITMTGTGGSSNWNPGFGLAKNNTTTKIYSTRGSINMSCPNTNGDPVFYGYSGNTGWGNFYIGYDGQSGSLGTTGDITILGDTKTGSLNALLWPNGATLSFKGQGNLRMGSNGTIGTGSTTTFSNTILGTAWKSISIGDNYMGSVVSSDNLTLASEATGDIRIVSRGDITINNPVNTSALAGKKITILAAQGSTTATGTLTTASGGTLTTEGGIIKLNSGVSEDNTTTVSTSGGAMTVNGAVSMGATALPLDWRSAGNMDINTDLSTFATSGKTIVLFTNQGVSGRSNFTANMTTNNADLNITSGTASVKASMYLNAPAKTFATNGGNLVLQNSSLGGNWGDGVNAMGVVINTSLNASAGNITVNGTGAPGNDSGDGIRFDFGDVQTTSGNIDFTGIGAAGTNWWSCGILFGGGSDKKIHTTSGNITMTGTGAASGNRPEGIVFYGSGGQTHRVYSTSGNITMNVKSNRTNDGHGIISGYGWNTSDGTNYRWDWWGCNTYIGAYDNTSTPTTGNISITGDTKNNACHLILSNNTNFKIRGQKDLTLTSATALGNGGMTVWNGMISGGNWRNITIGDKYMGGTQGITFNDNVITNASSTTGIAITSAGSLTLNNPVNTAAASAMPISLLATQNTGANVTSGTLTTATAATLTTNGGAILVRSGVDASGVVTNNTYGDVVVNGAVNTGATGVDYDWRTAKNLTLNTDISNLATSAKTITLLAAQGLEGGMKLAGNLITNNGEINLFGGLRADGTTKTGFKSSITLNTATASVKSNGANINIKNTSDGGTNTLFHSGQGFLTWGTIDASGTSTGGDITIEGTAKPTGDYEEGIYLNGMIKTNFDGKIDITGKGGVGTNRSLGMLISEGANTTITTENGDITLTGSGPTSGSAAWNQGFLFNNNTGNTIKIYSTTGDINLNCPNTNGDPAFDYYGGNTYIGYDGVTGNGTEGNINILGDTKASALAWLLYARGGNFKIKGQGELKIASYSTIGSATANSMTLNSNIQGTAWKKITLGDAYTGSVICNDALVSSDSIIIATKNEFSGSGNINSNGNPVSVTTGNASGTATYTGIISGTGSLTKLGTGRFILTNPAHTFTGKTILTEGELRLNPTTNATWASPVELNGGTLSTTNIGAYTFTSSSTLKLVEGSTLALGSNNHTLLFANSSADAWPVDKFLNVTGWQTTPGVSGTAGKLKFMNLPLTSAQLAQFRFNVSSNYYPGASIAANEVVPAGSTKVEFVSVQTGNWNDPATWGLLGTPVTGVNYPASTSRVTIADDDTVWLTANTTISDSLKFSANGTLEMNNYTMSVGSLTGGDAGAAIVMGSATLTVSNTNYSNFAGAISGTGGLTKAGTGSLTLSGTNTYTGATTLSAGNLEITGNGSLGSSGTYAGNISIAGGCGFAYKSSTGLTLSGIISGAGTLSKDSTSMLTLSGANTYTGATTITAGTLKLTSTNTSPSYAIASGAVVDLNIAASATIAWGQSVTISGAGTFRKTGTGWFNISNGSQWNWNLSSGALIDIQAGTLTMCGAYNKYFTNNHADFSIAAGAIAQFQESNVIVNSLTGAGTVQFGYNSDSYSFTVGVDGGSSTFDGVLANHGALGRLIKAGSGTLTLKGVNTYTGLTTINGGVLEIAGAGQLNSGAYGNYIDIAAGDTLKINSTAAQTLSGAIRGAGALVKNNTNTLTLSAANTFTGGTTINAGTIKTTVQYCLANNATSPVVINNGGTLSAASSDIFGVHSTAVVTPVIINAGGLLTNEGAWYSVLGPLTLNGGELTYTAGNSTYKSWALRGDVTVTENSTISGSGVNGAIMLGTCGTTNTNFNVAAGKTLTVSSNIQNGLNSSSVAQASSLTTTGTGVLLLTGVNSHTGNTNLNSGELRLNPTDNLAWNSPVVLNGGKLSTVGIGEYNINSSSTLNVTNFSSIDLDPNSIHTFTFANSSGVSWTAGKVLTINGWQGTPGITGTKGQIRFLSAALTTTQQSQVKFNINSTLYATSSIGGNEIVPSTAMGSQLFTSVTSGNWNDPATWGFTGTPVAGVNYPGPSNKVYINSSDVVTLTAATSISDSLKFISSGKLVMGTYTMSVSSLTAANSGASIDLSSGTLTVNNLIPDTSKFAGIISGTGGLTKSGTGTLVLSGANTYSGATTLSAGGFEIAESGTSGTGAVSIASGCTFIYNSTASQTISGIISGAGSLAKNNSGTLTLSGANTYSGATTISEGLLKLTSTNQSANYAIASGATLEENTTADRDHGGTTTFSGAGILKKTGAFKLSFNNATTFALSAGANINVEAGTFYPVGAYNKIFTNNLSDLNIAAGAVVEGQETNFIFDKLTGSGTIKTGYTTNYTGLKVGINNGSSQFDGVITNFTGQTGNLIKVGTGTLTLTGVNTYTGTTTVAEGGTLTIGGAGQLGSGAYTNSILIASGSTLNYNSTATQTFSAPITGTGGTLVKNNTSTLTLSAASNSFTGEMIINAGNVLLSGNYAAAASPITVNSNGTLTFGRQDVFGNHTATITTPIVINGGTVTNTNSGTTSYFSSLGPVTLNGGTISYVGGGSTSWPAWAFKGGVTVTANSSITGTSTGNSFGAIQINTGSTTPTGTINVEAGNTLTISALLQNGRDGSGNLTATNLTKSGAGILVLTGTNTYSGATNINTGKIIAGNASALGSASALVFANDASAVLDLNGNNLSVGSMAGGGTTGGNITSSISGAVTLTTGSANTSTAFSGVIEDGLGIVAVTKTGTGIQSFDGANTYTGVNTISAGTLQQGVGSTTGTVGSGTANINVASGATFAVNRSNAVTVDKKITGTGGIFAQNGTGVTTLTAANDYTGNTNINAGTLQLGDGSNATARVGTGVLAVNANTLLINLNAATTLPNSSVTSLANGLIDNLGTGKLTFANGSLAGITDGGTAGFVLSNVISSAISFRGDVTLGGTGAAYVVRSLEPGSTVHVSSLGGSFWWIGADAVGNAPNIDVASGVTLSNSASQAATMYYNNLSGVGNFTITGSGVSAYVLGTSSMTGTLTANIPVYFGNGGATGSVTSGNIVNNNSVIFNSTADYTYSGLITGSGTVVKNGTDTITFTYPTMAYTGSTTLNAGALKLNPTNTTATWASQIVMAGGTLSTAGITTGTTITSSSTLNVTNNSELDLEPAGTHNLKFANSSGVSWTSTKLLTIKGWQGTNGTTGTNGKFYVGNASGHLTTAQLAQTRFENGTAYTAASQLSSGTAGEVVPTATLYVTGFISVASGDWNAPATWGYSGAAVAGTTYPGATDNATISSGHTVTLTETDTANVLTCTGTLDMGSYNMTIGSLSGAGNVMLRANTLTLGDATTTGSFSGVISGEGSLIKLGTGIQTFTNANTYTGGTTVNAGKLVLSKEPYTLANNSNNTLTINNGGTVSTGANWALGYLNPVIINTGGTLTTQDRYITCLGPLTLAGGTLTNTVSGWDGNWHNWLLQGTVNVTENSTINGVGANAGVNLGLSNHYNNSMDNFVGFNIAAGKTLTVNAPLYNRYNGSWNAAPLALTGGGTLILNGANGYSGATTISEGLLKLTSTNSSVSYDIASGAVLEENCTTDRDHANNTTYTGAGTFRKTGTGTLLWGGSAATFAFSAGALIDVQAGKFTGGSSNNEVWTNNKSDLNVASGAIFNTVEANVYVDKLTGAGTVGVGCAGNTPYLNVGINNGTSTFNGIIQNTDASGSNPGNFIKLGTGMFTLTGATHTYTGTTTLTDGTLKLNPSSTTASWATSKVIFNGGTLSTVDIATGTTLTCSGIIKLTDNSTLELDSTGTNTHNLKFANSSSESWTSGKFLTINSWKGTNGATGANGHLTVGTATSHLSAAQLLQTRFNKEAVCYNSTMISSAEVVPSNTSFATSFVSVTSGTWNNPATWGYTGTAQEGVNYPGTTDNVTISSGHTVALATLTTTSGVLTCTGTIQTGTNNLTVGSLTGTGSITLGTSTFTVGDATATTTFSGIINGTGNLTKQGAGILILSGNNTYSGGTTISAGTLKAGSATAFGSNSPVSVASGATLDLSGYGNTVGALSGSGSIVASAALTFGDNTDKEFSGIISGSGTLTKTGFGKQTLSGVNTFTGAITVNADTLEIGGTGKLNSGTYSNTITVNSGATFSYNSTSAQTLSGNIAGAGTFVKENTSTLTLTAANSFTGNIIVNGGTLTGSYANADYGCIGHASRITVNDGAILMAGSAADNCLVGGRGTIQLNTGGSLNTALSTTVQNLGTLILAGGEVKGAGVLSGNSLTYGRWTVQNVIVNAGTSTTSTISSIGFAPINATFTVNQSGASNGIDLLVSGTFVNSNGTQGFTKTGLGTMYLTGVNTYTGATNINAGVVKAGNASALGNSSALSFANNATAILDMNGYNLTVGSLAGGGTTGGIVTNKVTTPVTLTTGSANTSTTFSGMMKDDAGTVSLTKIGTGTQIFDGTNTFTGTTTLSAGILQLGNAGITGTLGTGAIVNNASLVINRSNSVTIPNIISGTGAVTQSGTGTTILTGANTYAGTTTISSGTLQVGNAGTSGTLGTGAITDNASLIINRSDEITIASIISGSGTLTQQGTGTAILSAANTYTGATSINTGTLKLVNTNNTTSYFIETGAVLEENVASGSRSHGGSTTYTGGGTLRKTGAGELNYGSSATFALSISALIDVREGTFSPIGSYNKIFTNNLSDMNVESIATVSGQESDIRVNKLTGSGTINTGYSSTYTGFYVGAANGSSTFGGVIADYIGQTGKLVKIGTGTITLTGTNTYTGTTAINGGILELANTGKLSSGIHSGAISIASGSTLNCNITASQTLSGVISGAGALIKNNTGTVTLSGTNTYTGGTTINAGKLKTTVQNCLVNNALSPVVINGGTLSAAYSDLFGSHTTAIVTPVTINTGGKLTNEGAYYSVLGPLTLNGGELSYIGGSSTYKSWALAGGVVITENSTISGSGTNGAVMLGACTIANTNLNVSSGKTLTISGLVFDGLNSSAVSQTSSLTKLGSGTVLLSGANTYTGVTYVSGGTLKLGSATALGTSSQTNVTSGACLDLNGTTLSTARPLTLNGTGILSGGALVNNGTQAASFSGGITLGSATSIVSANNITLSGNVSCSNNDLTLSGTSSASTISGVISGTGLVTKLNTGTWIYTQSANTYTGTTTVNAGELRLNPTANATFVSKIVLNGGNLSTTGITTGRTWTSSKTLAVTDNSAIALDETNEHILTFADCSGETWTADKMLGITGWTGTVESSGAKGKLFIGNSDSGLGTTNLSQVRFDIGGINYLAIQLSNGEVTPKLPVISVTGSSAAFTTTYGTVSASQNFAVSSSGLTVDITATASTGFEVSNNGTTYGSTTTIAKNASGTLSVRLASNAAVAGTYNSVDIVLSSPGAANKTITTTATGNIVTPKTITITGVTANDKEYDRTNVATLSGGSLDGVINPDVVTIVSGTGAFADANVGTGKVVIVSGYGISGADAGNYSLSAQPTVASANITAKPLTITGVTASNKVYDGTTTATLSGGTLTGVISPDVVTIVPGTGAFTDANVGTGKTVIASGYGIDGADAGNYELSAQPSGMTADITASVKQLSVTAYLQGLWNGSSMNQCLGDDGITPVFADAADTVSIELHDAANYSTIVYRASGLYLNTDGTIHGSGQSFIEIPSAYSGSYYVTVRTRNHLETTSSEAISFAGSTINYNFTDAIDKAYGGNMADLGGGLYGLYAGDIPDSGGLQDGFVDASDAGAIDNMVSQFGSGYLLEDLNGDSFVDATDAGLIEGNVNNFIAVILP